MVHINKKKFFGFQAKVLFPVVTILILLLAVIMWLVNRRLVDELQEEARQNVSIAEAVFRNSFDIRTRNLLLRYELLVNEPRLRAVAQLAEPKTMTAQLKELLEETGPEAKVIIYTTDPNVLFAGVQREPGVDLQQFRIKSTELINRARLGQGATGTLAIGNRLFNVISVPVFPENILAGVLTIGVEVGATAAQELKSLTRSEVVFLANNEVAASTITNGSFHPALISAYRTLTSALSLTTSEAPEPMAITAPNGEQFLCLARPFAGAGRDVGYLLLSSYQSALEKTASTQRILIVLSLAGILSSSLLIWAFIRKATRPLRELRQSAEAVGGGDFTRRVQAQTNDELGELAIVFNRMTENLMASRETLQKAQAQLVQSEKLSAIGEFVAGVAHELNNPLTGVIGFSEMLRESGISEQQQSLLNRVIDCAGRCQKIVQSLLSFSRRRLPERKTVLLNELVQGTIDLVKHDLAGANIDLISNLSSDIPPLSADPHQIEQVFLNLLNNAKQAIQQKGNGGTIRVSTQLAEGHARVRFQDDGCGIAENNLDKIFNPFFTTKPVGEGTGLGLSLSYGIIREHGGTIGVQSGAGEDTIFTIELPVSRNAAPAVTVGKLEGAPSPAFLQSRTTKGRKILVIDDEESILELIQHALTASGYKVDTAKDAVRGLQMIKENRYDLIICDWKIPGMQGREVYQKARSVDPSSAERFLFVTGNVLSAETEQFLQSEHSPYLLKPFSISELRETVDRLLSVEKSQAR